MNAEPSAMSHACAPKLLSEGGNPDPASPAIRLLLVEDDFDCAEAMRRMLEKRGVRVAVASSAESGIALFAKERGAFDAVVADIRLPGLNGVQVLRRVRESTTDLPFILITGYDAVQSAIEAIKLGVQDYILKPFDTIEDLLLPLQRAVLHYRTEKEKRALARTLVESERRFREFFENQPEYCYMVSPAGLVLDVNRAALRALGYEKDELVGQPFRALYAPECLGRAMEAFERWKTTGELGEVELTILGKDGRRRDVLLNASAVRDERGAILHSVSIQCDITERKTAAARDAEYRRRLQLLASELTVAEDRERRRVAVGLHESVLQLLGTARFTLDAAVAHNKLAQAEELTSIMARALDRAIEEVRTLTFELYPSVLYTYGLEAALCEFSARARREWGLAVEVRWKEPPVTLDKDLQAFLFRAVRELLFNVAKHSGAREADVWVRRGAGAVMVDVADKGKGFDVKAGLGKAGLGLFGVRERLAAMGGRFVVKSAPGTGTLVTLKAPMGTPDVDGREEHR